MTHSLLLQIPDERFEEINRQASEEGFPTIEAFLMDVALRGRAAPPSHRPRIQTQSLAEPGRRGGEGG